MVVTVLAMGRAPGPLEGGWGAAGPPDRAGCNLPKVPEPLDGQGPHAAPGATAVLVGAASVERGRRLVSVQHGKGPAAHGTQAGLQAKDRKPPLHVAKLAPLTAARPVA